MSRVPHRLRATAPPLGTAAVSFLLTALIWTPTVALMLLVILAIHEYGHWWRIRAEGLRAIGPYLVPPIGAVAVAWPPATNAGQARIAFAGPVAGLAGGLVFLAASVLTGSPLLLDAAHVSFLLNLLNMLPMPPLDGGRIVGGLGPRVRAVGFVMTPLVLILMHRLVFLAVLAVLTPIGVWASEYHHAPPLDSSHRRRTRRGYLLVTVFLATLTIVTR